MAELSEGELQDRINQAANAIREATALLFTSGAGMSVDSGLPDFRGPEGFWKAYPPMQALGLKFSMMSNPEWFYKNPPFAWGFWAHRLKLYRNAEPHYGYEVQKRLGESKLQQGGYFVFTSNVDGAFAKAGFDEERIIECHGCIHYLQCVSPCGRDIWSAEDLHVEVDERTFLSPAPLPKCIHCNALSRPNVLMFGDMEYEGGRYSVQYKNYILWQRALKNTDTKLVIIEIGAGTAVPTVRIESENMNAQKGIESKLIRINMRDIDAPAGSIVLPLGGKDAMTRIEKALNM